jgi:hypothetical protein
MHRLKTDDPMAITIGFAFGGYKNNAARVGVAGEFLTIAGGGVPSAVHPIPSRLRGWRRRLQAD